LQIVDFRLQNRFSGPGNRQSIDNQSTVNQQSISNLQSEI